MSDYLHECNDRGEAPQNFMGTFCSRCKNQNCQRAGWGTSRWRQRMETQEERFFNPSLLPEDHPLYKEINRFDFPSMIQEVLRQEIANRRGDWEIPPEIPVLDGRNEVAQQDTTRVVDEAVQALASSQGRKVHTLPTEVECEADEHSAVSEPPVDLIHAEEPTPTMKNRSRLQNTEMPSEGVMIEGEVPTTTPTKKIVKDPWAPSTEKKIPVGGTVVLGKRDEE